MLLPAPMELGLFEEQYAKLVAALEAEGYDVDLVAPTEYRGSLPPLPDLDAFYNLVVQLREAPEYPLAVTALIALIRKQLRGKAGRRTRTGILHLPNGGKHEFEMSDEE